MFWNFNRIIVGKNKRIDAVWLQKFLPLVKYIPESFSHTSESFGKLKLSKKIGLETDRY